MQFTADLMPSDIIGTSLLVQDEHGKRLAFQPGPLFTNLLLADEINRATPKTQAALLEAMEEHSVTVGGVTTPLDEPFFILATQNPIEQDGTYPLPKAQFDKFLFKLHGGISRRRTGLVEVAMRTTFEQYPEVRQVVDGAGIRACSGWSARCRWPRTSRSSPCGSRGPRSPSRPRAARHRALRGVGHRAARPAGHAACGQGPGAGAGEVLRRRRRRPPWRVQALQHRIQRNLEAEAEDCGAEEILRRILDEVEEAVAMTPENSEPISTP